MLPAHYYVRYTLAALGGPTAQNAEDLLFAVNAHLLEIEGRLSEEPGRDDVKDRYPGPHVPAELLPLRKTQPAARQGFPGRRFFDDLLAFVDYILTPPLDELSEHFNKDPVGREPRIMRSISDVRRQVNIAVVEIVGTALPQVSDGEMLLQLHSAISQLSIAASDAPVVRAYKRLSLETKQLILSFCASFIDIQRLLYTTRWGPAAARNLDRLYFTSSALQCGEIPRQLSHAWPLFNLCSNVLYIRIDTPLQNNAAPRNPPWDFRAAEVNMGARALWSDFNLRKTLGILAEKRIPDFTVVRPSEAAARHFCWNMPEKAVSIALLLRKRKRKSEEEEEEEYDIVLARPSGFVRVLRDVEPEFERFIFDRRALCKVSHLVLPDNMRCLALSALYDAELTHIVEFEVYLDEKSGEPAQRGEEPTRLLQQPFRRFPRTLNFPSIRRLTISARRPRTFSHATVMGFRAMLSGGSAKIEGMNVQLV